MHTTLVIPCYNEEESIPFLCARLRVVLPQLPLRGGVEILFVDDGSTDGTAETIRKEAAGLPYRIVVHEQNRGLGAALKTGFAAGKGSEIVTLDCDGTYDPMQIESLLEALRRGKDVVTGSPYHPDGEVVDVVRWRLFVSKSLSYLYWAVLPRRLYTYTSCFRAYRRSVLNDLEAPSDGFLAVTQLLVSAILKGMHVSEVPARLTARRSGKSKIRLLGVALSHCRYMIHVLRLRLSGRTRRAVAHAHGHRGGYVRKAV